MALLGELRVGEGLALRGKGLPKRRVFLQAAQGVGQARRVPRLEQQAGLAVFYDLRHAACVGADNGRAGAHGLDEHEAEGLGIGGQHHHVETAHDGLGAVVETVVTETLADPPRPRVRQQFIDVGLRHGVADEHGLDITAFAGERVHRLQ